MSYKAPADMGLFRFPIKVGVNVLDEYAGVITALFH